MEGAGEVGLDDTHALSAHRRVLLPINTYYFLFNEKSVIFTYATWNVSKNRVVCLKGQGHKVDLTFGDTNTVYISTGLNEGGGKFLHFSDASVNNNQVFLRIE